MVIELEFSGMSKCAKPWGITCRLLSHCGDAEKDLLPRNFHEYKANSRAQRQGKFVKLPILFSFGLFLALPNFNHH
jgi:hypothetical protein